MNKLKKDKVSLFVTICFCLFCFGCSSFNSVNKKSKKEPLLSDQVLQSKETVVSNKKETLLDNEPSGCEKKQYILETKEDSEQDFFDKVQLLFDEALVFCDESQKQWKAGEIENALMALDQAYALILEVQDSDIPKIMQQKENLRLLISKRVIEIHASRYIKVKGQHNAIPIHINNYVQKEIDRFTKGNERLFFKRSLKRSGKYRPFIVEELRKAGLPESLSWLPLIESGFITNALSKARALGLWQFIPSTGYAFGLKRDMYVDERLDPFKSTKAAISYLKELHKIFGDWSTVLAAYNCGEGRILRVIRGQKINYLDNFWDLYEKLPLETARYVPRFIATLHIINNLERYGFDSLKKDNPLEYQVVEISKQLHINDIASKLSVLPKILVDLNPELRYKILPDEKYLFKVPVDKKNDLVAAVDTIPVTVLKRRSFIYHRVRRGDSLSTIARRYKVSTRSIIRLNSISRRSYIVAGKLLKIPQRGYLVSKKTVKTGIPKKVSDKKVVALYTVKKGDSLWSLAMSYGTTAKKIKKANNLNSSNLIIGQKLRIPEYTSRVSGKQGKSKKVYFVKRGDNPFTIAKNHKLSLKHFLQANSLTASSKIFPGQQVYLY